MPLRGCLYGRQDENVDRDWTLNGISPCMYIYHVPFIWKKCSPGRFPSRPGKSGTICIMWTLRPRYMLTLQVVQGEIVPARNTFTCKLGIKQVPARQTSRPAYTIQTVSKYILFIYFIHNHTFYRYFIHIHTFYRYFMHMHTVHLYTAYAEHNVYTIWTAC